MRKKVGYILHEEIVKKIDIMSKEFNCKKSHIIEKAIDYYYSIASLYSNNKEENNDS